MSFTFPLFLIAALPFFVMRFEKRLRIIEWLSPVVTCYVLGILLGNLPILSWSASAARKASEVSILLAIPLFLLATDFPAWFKLAGKTILSFLILIVCVVLVSFSAGKIFADYDPEVWKMSGMLAGVYIGGTANLTAIGKMLVIRDEAFITLNAVDLVLGGFYLLLIMSVGVKLLTKIFVPFDYSLAVENESDLINWRKLSFSGKVKNTLWLLLLSGVLIAVSVGFSLVLTGKEDGGIIILGLTSLALGLSFIPKIRYFEGSQECGQYFLLVFCIAVGSLANVSELMAGKVWYFLFCAFVMFGSILLHFLCCFFLKIDRDTAIITSMAGIFGPAFIPAMSQVLKNRAILVSGITTGLVGLAVGNFAGLFVSWLLNSGGYP